MSSSAGGGGGGCSPHHHTLHHHNQHHHHHHQAAAAAAAFATQYASPADLGHYAGPAGTAGFSADSMPVRGCVAGPWYTPSPAPPDPRLTSKFLFLRTTAVQQGRIKGGLAGPAKSSPGDGGFIHFRISLHATTSTMTRSFVTSAWLTIITFITPKGSTSWWACFVVLYADDIVL